MTAPLLHVGDATVWPSWFGGHIVDNGSAFPQHFADRRTAYAEAAARTLNSPSTGGPEPVPATGVRVVTPGGAGLPDGSPVGRAPESASPRSSDSGASSSPSPRRTGTDGSEGVVGATVEVTSPPPEASGVAT
jgi:hypothetical protein